MSGLIALLLVVQDSGVSVRPGEPTDEAWPVAVTANFPDDTTLTVTARRIERVWLAASNQFGEVLSEEVRRRRSGTVQKKAFSVELKVGPAGLYRISVANDARELHDRRAALGRAARLFTAEADALRKFAQIAEHAKGYLAEIEKIVNDQRVPSRKQFDDFQARLAKDESPLASLRTDTDLTATARLLKDIYYHLRNAQVWARATKPGGPADNDQHKNNEGIFLDPNLTLDDLRKQVESVPTVLSMETRVSIATILEDQMGAAPTDAKKEARHRARMREAAKAALKLVRETPEVDDPFLQALEPAASADDFVEVRAALAAYRDSHLRRS